MGGEQQGDLTGAQPDTGNPSPSLDRPASARALEAEVRQCTRCPLAQTRSHAVPGEGSLDAEIMLVGEGPGYHEDRQGRPFVGAAGQVLDELLGSIGLSREQVYITNVVKCRPPQNRDPAPQEVAACAPYLDRQLALVEPAIVVTLGRHALARFLPGKAIGRVHGRAHHLAEPAWPGRRGGLTILPLYHPAAALHNPALMETVRADALKIKPLLEEVRGGRAGRQEPGQAGPGDEQPNEATQLSLF